MGNKDSKRNTNKLFELLKRWINSNDDINLIKFIQENQECLNQKNNKGETPLMIALSNQHN